MTKALQKYDVEVLELPAGVTLLDDNQQWTNRFDFQSASGNTYRVAQHKTGRYWGCDCPSYKFGRRGVKTCKHLTDFGLKGNYVAEEVGRIAIGGRVEAVGANTLRDKDRRAAAQGNLRALPAPKAAAPVAKPAQKAPAAPKAIASGLRPENVELTKDGKIVVTFDASNAQAVFALLATLS